jgi:hypothetical protein
LADSSCPSSMRHHQASARPMSTISRGCSATQIERPLSHQPVASRHSAADTTISSASAGVSIPSPQRRQVPSA